MDMSERTLIFSPREAPVYGGEMLEVRVSVVERSPDEGSLMDELFLVLQGHSQLHIIIMHHSHQSTWVAPLPGHGCAEKVVMSVVHRLSPEDHHWVGSGEFYYQYDSAYFLAQFLVNSVNNVHALDDLELIKSDQFDLANEILSTLDERLGAALRHMPFPDGWHLLGSEQDVECEEDHCRETLLHFTGRLGLHKTAVFLLSKAGAEEALYTINRDGQLPCGVATHSGFQDIAELFSGYNTSGMVTEVDEDLDTENGIIHTHSNKGTSLTILTTSSDPRLIGKHIEALRDMDSMMRHGRSPTLWRRFQSEWPSSSHLQHRGHHDLLFGQAQGPQYSQQVEETLERICQDQRAHRMYMAPLLSDSTVPGVQTMHSNGASEHRESSSQQYTSPHPAIGIPAEVMEEATRQYGILEGSLRGVRGISEGLLILREETVHTKHLESQAERRLRLARFSISCPSLDADSEPCLLSPIHEGDQHKSMLDLAEEHGSDSLRMEAYFQPDSVQDVSEHDTHSPSLQHREEDGAVQICVNGATLNSMADSPLAESATDVVVDVVRRRRSGRISITRDEEINRRRSWCPDSPCHYRNRYGDADHADQMDAHLLARTGKSMSLSRLDSDEGSDEVSDEDFQSREELPAQKVKSTDKDFEKTGQSVSEHRRPHSAQSLTDLSYTTDTRQLELRQVKPRTSSASTSQELQGYEEWDALCVAHSNMTKSVSTPSILAATKATDDAKEMQDGRREGKHAKFCRQDEIEEEEEESALPGVKREISWKDFLNEELGASDVDEKSRVAGRGKEEKKRKPSVFTRFQNSYRTKKQKDKETKPKHPHHFVAVSFSNATQCHVCHKPMANKPALRCENCLINVHEHNCKDQVAACDKYTNMKVLQREGSAPAAIPHDRQVAALQGTGLRSSGSFKLKDNRSSSAPVKSQTSVSMAFAAHRSPAGSKAISETDETDGPQLAQDVGHSNIIETTSESLESLDTVGTAEAFLLEEEPDLMLGVDEPEAWNITVDRKTLKKMNAKDIKRQDTIWELIQTEKHYVKRLKIMQKLFRDPMCNELSMPWEQTERMFPHLDQLVAVHTAFLRSLLALQMLNLDRSVDEIGTVLLHQFSDSSAQKMKAAYGVFCSKHTEAIQLYKDIGKTDRKFQNFCRKISNLSVCEKRELPDFILGVTVRLSKYPILIEAILKGTKDKKDREQVSKALQCSKVVVHSVDRQVAQYEKLMEVYRAFDSRTTLYGGKKFKRQDLIASGRHLLHSGAIGWKNARGRVVETHTLVLTDLMVFLQKNEQKYTFLIQDNKSCVVPLYKLLVREKRDERDSHGIYVISQKSTEPEMYELVCRTREERDQWMQILQDAIKHCPEEDEVRQPEVVTEEERRKQKEKSTRIKEIIEELHRKDDLIKECCDEKNRLMLQLMEVSTAREDMTQQSGSQHDLNSSTSVEVVQAAIQEASHLTMILQGSGTQLSRSASSVGEHVSTSYINMPVPKRAETFAGFDSYDAPKTAGVAKRRFVQQYGDDNGRIPSEASLQDTIYEDSVYSGESRPGLSPQSLPSSSSSISLPLAHHGMWEHQSLMEHNVIPMEVSSEAGSMGELSASSVSSLVQHPTSPTSTEQMMSIVQLVRYLHNLMNLTTKQCTTVESLRAELAEAKEEISKLSADMHGRKNIYRHNQLEELRNLQENISRERQEWERQKEKEQAWIQQEKGQLEAKRLHLEKQESELRVKKEELRRERESVQHQMWVLREQGLLEPTMLDEGHVVPTMLDEGHLVHTIDLDTLVSADTHDAAPTYSRHAPGHRRSASADFYQMVPGAPKDIPGELDLRGMFRRPRHSVSSVQSVANPGTKSNIPAHLMSTRNEQRVGGANVQQLPMKLSLSSFTITSGGGAGVGLGAGAGHRPILHHTHPRAASLGSLGARAGGSGTAPITPSPAQVQGMITRNQNSRSTPSNLALVMKLAEPGSGGKGRPAPHPPNPPTSTNPAPGGPGAAPGGPADNGAEKVIYF